MPIGRRRGLWTAALLVTTTLATTVAAAPAAAAGIPAIVTGHRNGPVNVHGANSYRDVASISVPAGRWAIAAKLGLYNTAAAARTVFCRLQAGADLDQSKAHLGTQGSATGRSTPTLQVAHVDTARGTARLRCRANGPNGDVIAHDIRLQAMRAGTLETYSMADEAGDESGSGLPVVVHGGLADPVSLPSAGAATLPLTAGHWAITAKGDVTTVGAVTPVVDCMLLAPEELDRTSVHPNNEGGAGDSVPIALAGMLDLVADGNVTLDCDTAIAGEAELRFVGITAVLVGTYAYDELGGADPTPVGGAKPIVVGGYRAGPANVSGNGNLASVGTLHVGKGKWSVTAKVALQSGGAGGYARCQLVAGGDTDDSLGSVDPGGDNDRRSAAMALSHTFAAAGGGNLQVRCSSNTPTGSIQARAVRIVAIKAGTLTGD